MLYDIVLMDIQMPVMDGNAAARAIRSLKEPNSRVPIIAMTAHAFKEERERCLSNGMNDYVMKPFVPEDLCAKICKYTGIGQKGAERTDDKKSNSWTGGNFDLSPLVEECSGNIDELRKVLDVYSKTVPNDIAELESALKNSDADKAKMKMHALQTAFNYLGMTAAGNVLSEIEADGADYHQLLGRIADEWRQTLPQILDCVEKKR